MIKIMNMFAFVKEFNMKNFKLISDGNETYSFPKQPKLRYRILTMNLQMSSYDPKLGENLLQYIADNDSLRKNISKLYLNCTQDQKKVLIRKAEKLDLILKICNFMSSSIRHRS